MTTVTMMCRSGVILKIVLVRYKCHSTYPIFVKLEKKLKFQIIDQLV